MRLLAVAALALALGWIVVGCGPPRAKFEGPTVDAFNGKVVADGKPVKFPDGEHVYLKLYHETAQSFDIPLQPDGTFKIGWMPIGKYAAALMRQPKGAKGGPGRQGIPDFSIKEGQTEYVIELGKNFKP